MRSVEFKHIWLPIAALLVGLLAGGAFVFFALVGMPQAKSVPGTPIPPPEASGVPPRTAQIVLHQEFLNEALNTVFRELKPPTFEISSRERRSCQDTITIVPTGSGVNTNAQFADNKLRVPLAFTGTLLTPIGCIPFSGWAQANLELRFDRESQEVYGALDVESVNVDGVNAIWSRLITPFVQSAINSQINPVRLIDTKQLAVSLPIAASNGVLKAAVSDVRAEIKDNALNLFLIWDFSGAASDVEQPAS
jgi:hypothetical protein